MARRSFLRGAEDDSNGFRATVLWLRMLLVAAIVLPATLFCVVAYYDRVTLLREAGDRANRTVQALREHALRVFDGHGRLLADIDHRIQGMSWAEIGASSAALSTEMAGMIAKMPEVSAFMLTDSHGQVQASTRPAVSGRDVPSRDFYQAQALADRGVFIGRQFIGPSTGRRNFGLSRRRSSASGAFDGIEHVSIVTTYFTDFWSQAVGSGTGDSISLLREDGAILARLPDVGMRNLVSPPTSAVMQRVREGALSGTLRAVSPVDGIERIFAFARVDSYPVFIGYGLSVPRILADWYAHILIFGGLCAAFAAILFAGILWSMAQVRKLEAEHRRREEIEEAAKAARRLEILGELAAGVAHDFANVLWAIASASSLTIQSAGDPGRVTALAQSMSDASRRGLALTTRMLDFARRVPADGDGMGVADPAAAAQAACDLLLHSLGANWRLDFAIEKAGLPALVRGEANAIEAAVMNLAVNARDAMPRGGVVSIRLAAERVGEEPHPASLPQGLYARVSVADAGNGMAPEVLARAGEPFFTTKPRGQGTGLGLSGTRGFVERYGGKLRIESGPGRGAKVTFWLPEAPALNQAGEPVPHKERAVSEA